MLLLVMLRHAILLPSALPRYAAATLRHAERACLMFQHMPRVAQRELLLMPYATP